MSEVPAPKLSAVAPLTNSLVIMFVWLNLLIGLSLILQAPNLGLSIVNSYAASYIWGAVFFGLSLLLLVGKLTNKWSLIRFSLMVGLFTKLIFTYALVVLGFAVGIKAVIGVLALWIGITWVQFFTVLHFGLPGKKYDR